MKCSDLDFKYPPQEIDRITWCDDMGCGHNPTGVEHYDIQDVRGFTWPIFLPPDTVLVGPEIAA
jgi:hypothetical protein